MLNAAVFESIICTMQSGWARHLKHEYLSYLLGTPDTSLRGLSTLKALKAFTSKLSESKNDFTKIVAILKQNQTRNSQDLLTAAVWFQKILAISPTESY